MDLRRILETELTGPPNGLDMEVGAREGFRITPSHWQTGYCPHREYCENPEFSLGNVQCDMLTRHLSEDIP